MLLLSFMRVMVRCWRLGTLSLDFHGAPKNGASRLVLALEGGPRRQAELRQHLAESHPGYRPSDALLIIKLGGGNCLTHLCAARDYAERRPDRVLIAPRSTGLG